MRRARLGPVLAVCVLAGFAGSCAYYNTFYLARKYYMKATDGQPYEVDREGSTQRVNYNKSGDYSKKLLGVYPRSKYVDDAWLLWAKTFIGTDDPLKAVTMLQEFETRFEKSDLRPDAEFFLGLAYRAGRKHEQAVAAFDEFLAQSPKHPLVPYAFYERSKAFMSLQRYREAAESAGEVLKRFPGHPLADRALRQRAEARFQQHDWTGARADFRDIGARALTDDERTRFLLREVDCLESSRTYDEARALLRDARSHVPPPPPLPVAARVGPTAATNPAGGTPPPPPPVSVVRTPAEEQYGRLTLRMGGVELLAGRLDQAVSLYQSVLADYPRSQLAAEAQFRIGFAYETGADDFARARAEYAKVREQTGASQFTQQAQARLENLDRIDRYRTAGGADSLARQAEARFLTAEHYLFNLERPERALEAYKAISDSNSSPAVKARAMNAQAWVLSRKLEHKEAADSLFWKVVREYPATEAQLAARDYLETEGQVVPDALIVAPEAPSKPLLDTPDPLTTPPANTPRLGEKPIPGHLGSGPTPPGALGDASQWRNPALPDSLRRAFALRDSVFRMASADTSAVGRARVDSLRRALAQPDTVGLGARASRAAMLDEIARGTERPQGVIVAPDSTHAPVLSAGDSTRSESPPAPARSYLPGPLQPPARFDRAPFTTPTTRTTPRRESVNALADSARRTLRVDSTHTSAVIPKRVFTLADSMAGVVPSSSPAAQTPAPAAEPAKPADASHSIVEPFRPRLTRAERDSVKRATAFSDSLKRAARENAKLQRARARAHADSLKRGLVPAPAKPPAQPPAKPPAPPPAPARPDSARADSTRADSTHADSTRGHRP